MTTEELTKRYKEIYKKKTGKELTDEEALEQALQMVHLVKTVYQPVPKKDKA